MKPQSAAFLNKSRELLDQADTMLRVSLNEAAGRTAYLAGLHAAQAFLFETTGNVFRKHSTVQGEFGRLTKDNPRVDDELRAFLPRTYKLKAIADYVKPVPARMCRPRLPARLSRLRGDLSNASPALSTLRNG